MLRLFCRLVVSIDYQGVIDGATNDVAYLARYGGQSIDMVETWPVSKIRRYADRIGEIVKGESKT